MHTVIGAEILSGSQEPLLCAAENIARSHHERWDGTGYPGGLRGPEIPLVGRVTAVADAFDVMTHPRRYGDALTEEAAITDIVRQRGRQFDPAVVDALVELCERGALAAWPEAGRGEGRGGYIPGGVKRPSAASHPPSITSSVPVM
jgi:putative two-component system response regulator